MSAAGVSLQAAVNGPSEHPAAPRTPAALEADARECVAAGADGIHLHPYSVDGRESLAAVDVDAAVSAVRMMGIEVSVTTGAWIEPDLARRLELIRSWRELPDVCSVNFSEEGAEEVCRALAGRGVQVEVGLSYLEDVDRFVRSGTAGLARRVLVEPPESDGALALAAVGRIEAALDAAGLDLPRLLHADGPGTWDVLRAAKAAGRAIRIGFEDVSELPDGTPASSNAQLVRAAADL